MMDRKNPFHSSHALARAWLQRGRAECCRSRDIAKCKLQNENCKFPADPPPRRLRVVSPAGTSKQARRETVGSICDLQFSLCNFQWPRESSWRVATCPPTLALASKRQLTTSPHRLCAAF